MKLMFSRIIIITCQGHVLVILVPSQRAILECNFKSGGRLPSIHTLDICAIDRTATMAPDIVYDVRVMLLLHVLRNVTK